MNKRNHKKQLKNLICAVVAEVQMDAGVCEQSTGVNMSYDFIQNRVYFDFYRVQEARLEMDDPVSLEQYIRSLTIHELGHAMDRETLLASMPRMIEIAKVKRKHSFTERKERLDLFKTDIDSHEMEIGFEETAWKHAETLNRLYQIADWDSFHKVVAHSMKSYTKYYEKDLQTYRKLLIAARIAEKDGVAAATAEKDVLFS